MEVVKEVTIESKYYDELITREITDMDGDIIEPTKTYKLKNHKYQKCPYCINAVNFRCPMCLGTGFIATGDPNGYKIQGVFKLKKGEYTLKEYLNGKLFRKGIIKV